MWPRLYTLSSTQLPSVIRTYMLPICCTDRHVDFDVATHASQERALLGSYHHRLLFIIYATQRVAATSTYLSTRVRTWPGVILTPLLRPYGDQDLRHTHSPEHYSPQTEIQISVELVPHGAATRHARFVATHGPHGKRASGGGPALSLPHAAFASRQRRRRSPRS